MTLSLICARAIDELRRGHCRVTHGPNDVERCNRCSTVRDYELLIAMTEIVQTPSGAAEQVRESVEKANNEGDDNGK